MENQTQSIQKNPMEVKKWNWGAFAFNIWWGIGHKTYLPLLCLVPFLNVVWIFICGAKGNEWAYMGGNYSSPEEFKKSQETWNRAGFIATIAYAAFLLLSFIFSAGIFAIMLAVIQQAGTTYY